MIVSEFPIQPVGPRHGNNVWVNTFSQRRYSSDMVGLPIVGLGAVDTTGETAVATQLAAVQACASPQDYALLLTETQRQLMLARNGQIPYADITTFLSWQATELCESKPKRQLLYVGLGVGAAAVIGGLWYLAMTRH